MAIKENGCWRVRIRSSDLKVDRIFPKGTPKEVVDEFEMRVKFGSLVSLRQCPSFSDFSERWIFKYASLRKTESSIIKDKSTLKHHLLPAFKNRTLGEIRPTDIIELQVQLKKRGFAAQSINNIVSLASSILASAVIEELIPVNPCACVSRIKKEKRAPTFWTFEETDRFLNYCQENDYEFFQMVAFSVTTGLRPGELQALKRDCLDFIKGTVEVRRNWCTKTNKLLPYTKGKTSRVIPINPHVLSILSNKRGLKPDDFVFPFTFNSIGFRRLRPLCEKAGVKVIRFHDLRHTFASHLVMRGEHLVTIQELLGHSKSDSTQIYTHLADGFTKDSTRSLTQGMSWINSKNSKVISIAANPSF